MELGVEGDEEGYSRVDKSLETRMKTFKIPKLLKCQLENFSLRFHNLYTSYKFLVFLVWGEQFDEFFIGSRCFTFYNDCYMTIVSTGQLTSPRNTISLILN